MSHRLLHLSHFYSVPTLEGFQAIIITRSYWFERRAVVGYSALNVRAIRLAQSVGLHRLGSLKEDWEELEERKEEERMGKEAKEAKGTSSSGIGGQEDSMSSLFFKPPRKEGEEGSGNGMGRRSSGSSNAEALPFSDSSNGIQLNASSSGSTSGRKEPKDIRDCFGWNTENPILTREIGRRVWTCLCIIEYFLCG